MGRATALIATLLLTAALPAAASQGRAANRGERLAAAQCASCHAVGRSGQSPNPKSPPFRNIAATYEEHSLQKKLTEIDETGHYDMPPIRLHSNEISDLVAYFHRLNRKTRPVR